jgi:hypothetical protein
MSAVMTPAMAVVTGPVEQPDASSVASAAQRLAHSRSRLYNACHTVGDGPSTQPGAAGLATGVLNDWWAKHPMRLLGDVTLDAAKTLVQPVAQRHPVALVAGAAAVGALVVWSQPWRWLLTPALVAGLLPKIISQALNTPAPRQ